MKQSFILTGNEVIQAILCFLKVLDRVEEKDGYVLYGEAMVPNSITIDVTYRKVETPPKPVITSDHRIVEIDKG